MPRPTDDQRAALDSYIRSLVSLANGLTLDDFRTAQILIARRTERRVKIYIVSATVLFFLFLFTILTGATFAKPAGAANYQPLYAGLWGLSLGGLGAVASIFLHILKLVPQMTLKQNDEFEVIGRIILGCLFSTIFSLTIGADAILAFLEALNTLAAGGTKISIPSSPMLLLPFIAGYSITLVLGLLEKASRAIELTIGIEDRREGGARVGRRASRP